MVDLNRGHFEFTHGFSCDTLLHAVARYYLLLHLRTVKLEGWRENVSKVQIDKKISISVVRLLIEPLLILLYIMIQ